MSLAAEIEELARSRGAELFGVTSARPFARYLEVAAELETFPKFKELSPISQRINRGLADPKTLLPSAESIIVAGVFCRLRHADDDTAGYQGPHANLASYWRHGRPVIAGLGDSIAECLQRKGFEASAGRLPLKAAAVRAGLADYGKNAVVYNKEFGSWVSLVGVITNARLEATETESKDICGKCNRCVEACPTGALYAPYKLDVLKCVCYLSHSNMQDVGEIPDSLRERMGNWLCGCEVCQHVCPRNKKVTPRELSTSFNVAWHGTPIPDKDRLPLSELLQLLESASNPYFQRYAAICIGNLDGAEQALPALDKMVRSSEDALARKYAEWAVDRIKSSR